MIQKKSGTLQALPPSSKAVPRKGDSTKCHAACDACSLYTFLRNQHMKQLRKIAACLLRSPAPLQLFHQHGRQVDELINQPIYNLLTPRGCVNLLTS